MYSSSEKGGYSKEIAALQWSALTNQEVLDISILPLYEEDNIYDPKTKKIAEGGVLDMRLGIGQKTQICQTCHKKLAECPGHFGHISLALPIFHIGYFKYVVNILNCICKGCGKLLLNEESKEFFRERFMKSKNSMARNALFKKVMVECKKQKRCLDLKCNEENVSLKKKPKEAGKILVTRPKFNEFYRYQMILFYIRAKDLDDDFATAQNPYKFSTGYVDTRLENILESTKTTELSPLKALELFEKIPDHDVILLNMNPKFVKPKDLIVTQVLVPPVCIRPTVELSNGKTNEDDLTIKIYEILRANKTIRKLIEEGKESSRINEIWYTMQSLFTQYINSSTPGLPLHLIGSKAIRSLVVRIKGKHGRFRGNLSGKRADFTGRTVISPDPNIKIDQVIIPVHMAKILTFPERITKFNKDRLKVCILNGSDKYPGANYFISKDGLSKNNLMFGNRRRIAEELKIGDIVERHLIDNDIVLFNRQPSLHRLSIMCHRAKIMPWNTLRFNECVCTPYNADFDGDEMNIHVPQTIEAKAEAYYLMRVQENLITPKNGEPIVALTQDFLTSAFLITKKDVFYDRANFSQICSYFNDANEQIDLPVPAILKPIELWTGKQIINVLLRPNRRSKLVVNISLKERNYTGKEEVMCPKDGWVFIHNCELLSGNLGKSTLGSGSKGGLFYALIRDNSNYLAAEVMSRFAKLSSRWIGSYGMTISAADVSPSSELISSNEEMMSEAYEKCKEQINKYTEGKLDLKAGCTAEQTLESNINGILSKNRDLVGDICIKKLPVNNPPLMMFICGSKGSNINLCQMIACVGQQTVNGQRVPNGFTDRSLPHFEKNSKHPAAKGFVKNSFFTGLTATEFFFHTMGGREGLIDTAVKTAETGYMQRRLMKCLESLSVNYDYSVRSTSGEILQFIYGEDGLDPMMMEEADRPFNLDRLLKYTKTIYPFDPLNEQALLPFEIIAKVENKLNNVELEAKFLVTNLMINGLREYFLKMAQNIAKIRQNNGLSPCLAPNEGKEALEASKDSDLISIVNNIQCLTNRQLTLFFTRLWRKYSSALIVPGEAVGAVTSQSIGEPGTQMTLKTFHFAGVASMNITLGVPRIKEIINATREISTPIITARLVNDGDPLVARLVKGRIEKTLLGDICEYIKEVYSQEGCKLKIKLDEKTITALELHLRAKDVKTLILNTPRIGLKDGNIELDHRNSFKFSVSPSTSGGEKAYFALQSIKRKLGLIIVKGIPSISRAVINKEKDKTSDKFIYHLLVEGNGLLEVMNIPGIKGTHTYSNHIMEIEKYLGIEAARRSILSEIKYIMTMHGITVDIRHIGLLSEVMTAKGQILGITRFGLSKMKDATLFLASFEKTNDILFDAAYMSKGDTLNGVTESIIVGKKANIGTGICKVMWNFKDSHKESDVLKGINPIFKDIEI